MPNSSRCIRIAVIGILLFCCGVGLLFSAASLSSHRLPPGMASSPDAEYQDGDQLHAYNIIAITILGTGAALSVISLGAWIFSQAAPENRSWMDSR
jgi:hypothetical protein